MMTRDSEEDQGGGRHVRATWMNGGEGTGCPVCGEVVRGDRDIVEAHVDACLAYLGNREEEERREAERLERNGDIDIDGNGSREIRLRATDGTNLRGEY